MARSLEPVDRISRRHLARGSGEKASFRVLLSTATLISAAVWLSACGPEHDARVWVALQAEHAQVGQELGGVVRGLTEVSLAGDKELVVLELPESALDTLAVNLHSDRHLHGQDRTCGGFFAHLSPEAALQTVKARDGQQRATLTNYTLDNGPAVNAMIAAVDPDEVLNTIEQLSAFPTRHHRTSGGQEAAQWLLDTWNTIAVDRDDIEAELYTHAASDQPSVILTILGEELPAEVVVVGGHLDSIAQPNYNQAPGADDNASGIASITGMLHSLVAVDFRPKRTVELIAYAAEEVGLIGSNEIATDHRTSGVEVIGVMQLDMTGYRGSSHDIALVTDYTNDAQNAFVRDLVTTYLGYSLGETKCGYACSDHASWHAKGFAASFPAEAAFAESNPKIHTQKDTVQNLGGDAEHAARFSRLAAAFVAELAKGRLFTPPSDTGEPPTPEETEETPSDPEQPGDQKAALDPEEVIGELSCRASRASVPVLVWAFVVLFAGARRWRRPRC